VCVDPRGAKIRKCHAPTPWVGGYGPPPMTDPATDDDRPLRAVVACADRRIPLLAPGGAGVHLRAIARGLAAHGSVEAWVARTDPGERGPAAASPCPARVFPRGHLPGVLRRHRAWDAAVDAAAAARCARRWHAEAPIDLLYERAALFGAIGRLPGAARVVELNAPLAWEAAWFEGEVPRPALLEAEARGLADADLVVVVSEPLAGYAARRGVDPEAILVLPNGADRSPASSRRGRVLGYAGTFKPWHGLAAAASAVAALAPERVELWGDGPEREAAVGALREAGVAVDWRGWGTPGELAEARTGWWAAWVPRAAWPPTGSEAIAAAFGEAPPPPYFSPLKEAEAAVAGLAVWRGEGPLEVPARPRSWAEVAGEVLRGLDRRGVPAPRGSWFNAAGTAGGPGAS
jgi:glycosyltransferase involved in cell wall biosynthesis